MEAAYMAIPAYGTLVSESIWLTSDRIENGRRLFTHIMQIRKQIEARKKELRQQIEDEAKQK